MVWWLMKWITWIQGEVCAQPWCNPLWLTGLKAPTKWLTIQMIAIFLSWWRLISLVINWWTCAITLSGGFVSRTLKSSLYSDSTSFFALLLCISRWSNDGGHPSEFSCEILFVTFWLVEAARMIGSLKPPYYWPLAWYSGCKFGALPT